MIDWILHNKEWLFSGLRLAILIGLGKLLYSSLHRRALLPVSREAAPSVTGQAAVIPRVTSAVPTTVLHKNTTAAPEPSRKAAEKQDRVFVGASITPEYLISIFREHTDIQGATLTAAYLGKWMKVSGSLGNVISTTPNLAQLTFERAEVPLTERTWFDYTDFYMMFKKPWIDRLAIARRGDKLTVVGQIERIDAVSVQLENCELVGSDSN
jgi:hypothetical protein